MNQPSSREIAQSRLVKAFNEWMRRFIENPEDFKREFQSVIEYQKDVNGGIEPSYGQGAAAYLVKILDELPA